MLRITVDGHAKLCLNKYSLILPNFLGGGTDSRRRLNGAMDGQTGNRKPYQQYEIKDGIVFLIELTPALMCPAPTQPMLFEILSAISDLMSEMIITMRNTGIGIYIYNCEPSPVLKPMAESIPGFYSLMQLHPMTISSMKHLNDIVSDHKRGIRSIKSLFKVSDVIATNRLPAILGNILEVLILRPFFNRKKMLWLTSNDKPYTEKATGESVYRVINDYYNYGYFIRPILIGDGTSSFDMSQFKDMFLNTNFLDSNTSTTGFHGFSKDSSVFEKTIMADEIRSQIFRVKEVKRVKFSCNLILSDGRPIGGRLGCTIKGHSLYSKEYLKNDFLIYNQGENLKRVFTEQQDLPSDQPLAIPGTTTPAETKRGAPLNGGEVLFLQEKQIEFMKKCVFDHEAGGCSDDDEPEEAYDEIENEGEDVSYSERPFLKLLGFRSVGRYNPNFNMGSATFVTADTNDGLNTKAVPGGFQNSYTTFSSLYSSCQRLGKFAVLFGAPRKFQDPTLYALYPTRAKNSTMKFEDNDREFPEGFLLFRMPWLDDVRNLPSYFLADESNQYEATPDLPPELVYNCHKLLSQFFLPGYSPLDTPNPSLNFFYKVMKHQLLQIALPESEQTLDKNDVTYMRLAQLRHFLVLDKEKTALVSNINGAIQDHERANEPCVARPYSRELTSSIKRGSSSLGPKSTKKPSLGSVTLDEGTAIEAWKSNEWRHVTMLHLRDFQRRHSDVISPAKLKQEYIDNICRYLEAREKNQVVNEEDNLPS